MIEGYGRLLKEVKGPFALWLYGSQARGDSDELSDIDLLVVADDFSTGVEIMDRAIREDRVSVSSYSWDEIRRMAKYGSLFLLHLKLEGQLLSGNRDGRDRMKVLLGDLPPYRLAARDLMAFSTTIDDIAHGLELDLPVPFELWVLGGVVRHASVLACYLTGQPVFGRLAIREACRRVGLWELTQPLEGVHYYRLCLEAGVSLPVHPTRELAETYLEMARELVAHTQEYTDA